MDSVTSGSKMETTLLPGSRLVSATRCTTGGTVQRPEPVVEEVPVGLVYGGETFAVMLATPTDLEDFAVGFSLSEGIIDRAEDLGISDVTPVEFGVRVRMTLPVDLLAKVLKRRRNLMGGSGCGRCGTDSFAETLRPLDPIRSTERITPDAIHRAMAELPGQQRLNHQVGAVHAAGFAGLDGRILAVREDVGRHNALDKLIGALARAGIDPSAGFVVVSSRCSFEMVHKTAAAGIPLIAAVSAPTSLATDFAETVKVGVVAFAREGRFTVYAVPSRVTTLGE